MFKVSQCEEALSHSKIDLEDVIQNALTLKKMMSDHTHKKIIEDMLTKCPMEVVNRL